MASASLPRLGLCDSFFNNRIKLMRGRSEDVDIIKADLINVTAIYFHQKTFNEVVASIQILSTEDFFEANSWRLADYWCLWSLVSPFLSFPLSFSLSHSSYSSTNCKQRYNTSMVRTKYTILIYCRFIRLDYTVVIN